MKIDLLPSSVKSLLRSRRAKSAKTRRPASIPIQAHPWLLGSIVTVLLSVLVGVFIIAADAYRRYRSDSAAYLLLGVLVVIWGIILPLFWSNQIGLSFDWHGVRIGRTRQPPAKPTKDQKSVGSDEKE